VDKSSTNLPSVGWQITLWSHWQVASRSSEVNFTKNYTLLYNDNAQTYMGLVYLQLFNYVYKTTNYTNSVEEIHSVGTVNNVETSYCTQLKRVNT